MVDLAHDFYMVLLENDHITYEEYVRNVPASSIPPEYTTIALFLKNKGKVSKRIIASISDTSSHTPR